MSFELSVALKYLLPRRRQFSVSVIALISVAVIALVVWLVLVFLSVTRGIEQRWIDNLTSINGPMRLVPTEAYYDSYYYKIDSFSDASNYTTKAIGEKLVAEATEPYDPELDATLPLGFPRPDRDDEGNLRDPVQGAFAAIDDLHGFSHVKGSDYEVALANLRLRLVRSVPHGPGEPRSFVQSFLSQGSYLDAYDPDNVTLAATIMSPSNADIAHQMSLLALTGDTAENPTDQWMPQALFVAKAKEFFDRTTVTHLQVQEEGYRIPKSLYPSSGEIAVVEQGNFLAIAPKAPKEKRQTISFPYDGDDLLITAPIEMAATLAPNSLDSAYDASHLLFAVAFDLQGLKFAGEAPIDNLLVSRAVTKGTPLLVDESKGRGILLGKPFKDKGVLVGDSGYLSFFASTPSSVQEQRLPIYVAGFFDPGVLPTGSRSVLVDRSVTADIRSSLSQIDPNKGNGIAVWFDQVDRVDEAKSQLVAGLEERGLTPYWHVETYKEYEFAKPLVQQFQSDRNLFSLIAVIIIVVACSNIISMLILLVNDKRREIGILQSMGASPRSVAAIFALCGTVMGIVGSAIGVTLAWFTLHNLQGLIGLLSRLQGHDAFNTAFYGTTLPDQLSGSVLLFVGVATVVVSLFAGLVPAVKAARLKPAEILRSE